MIASAGARIEGNGLARNLTLSEVIEDLTTARTLNHSTLTALTWWKDHHGHRLCLMLDKTILREARNDLLEGKARRGNGRGKNRGQSTETSRPRTGATVILIYSCGFINDVLSIH